MLCFTVFCHFPCGVLGQECYLTVSIPDLCLLTFSNMLYTLVLIILWHLVKFLRTTTDCKVLFIHNIVATIGL